MVFLDVDPPYLVTLATSLHACLYLVLELKVTSHVAGTIHRSLPARKSGLRGHSGVDVRVYGDPVPEVRHGNLRRGEGEGKAAEV